MRGRPTVENLTLKLDPDTLLWARTRALFARTTVNELVRTFLEEYAAVPESFRTGPPGAWATGRKAVEVFVQVADPVEAAAAARAAGGSEADAVLEHIAAEQGPPS